MARKLLTDYLADFARRGNEPFCFHRRGYRWETWSYRRIAETAGRFTHTLAERAVAPGDRVLLWGDNSAEWIAAFFGCALRGAPVVPMDRIASPAFAQAVARQVEARLVVCSRALAGVPSEPQPLILEDLAALTAGQPPLALPAPALQSCDPLQIIFTSGTTAEPRGVVLSHRNVLANLEPLEEQISGYLKYERLVHPLRFLNLLPLSHVFGQFLGIYVPLLLGGVVVFLDSLNPSEIIETVRSRRVSVLVAVPRLLQSLRDRVESEVELRGDRERFRHHLESAEGRHFLLRWWRFRHVHRRFGWKFWAFISGGAALDDATEAFWSRLGFAVIQGYGLTETTSLVSVNHPFQLGRGSIGKVLAGREVKLAEDGEILVRGESVASGYWQGRQLQPISGEAGWFATGDIGELDAEGRLYFKGRKKTVLVTPEGMNVHPEDLEAALRRQPEVRDCAVVGLPRNGNAEPCAVLILQSGLADGAAPVRRANESLAEYQRMRRWLIWPEEDFPRTSTQKPRTHLILERVQQMLSPGGDEQRASGALAELIGRITGRPLPSLAAGDRLDADLNLSSIERVELLSALEDRFQTDLNETQFTGATTVADLERMLRAPAARGTEYVFARWPRSAPVRWMRTVVYYLLVWPATMLLARPRLFGRCNLASVTAPALFICNHITSLDIGFVQAALPPRLRHSLATAMEGERLWGMRRPPPEVALLRRLNLRLQYFLVLALFNVFPLPQTSGFRRSFQFAGEVADRGFSVLVFPEGHLTRDGRIAPFQGGIGLLVQQLGLPVVPLRIDGLFELKQQGRRRAPPGAVRVTVGQPVRYEPGREAGQITADLQRRVEALGG